MVLLFLSRFWLLAQFFEPFNTGICKQIPSCVYGCGLLIFGSRFFLFRSSFLRSGLSFPGFSRGSLLSWTVSSGSFSGELAFSGFSALACLIFFWNLKNSNPFLWASVSSSLGLISTFPQFKGSGPSPFSWEAFFVRSAVVLCGPYSFLTFVHFLLLVVSQAFDCCIDVWVITHFLTVYFAQNMIFFFYLTVTSSRILGSSTVLAEQ